jgi:hypothetical protein
MATTTTSMGPHEFKDADLQRIYELLKSAEVKTDKKSKAALLHALAKQVEDLAKKISPD